ncbi:hypothetical protein NKJ90_14800 [Mesorhizobium sp. M0051]|uniref:hypothetical protein n=1 Tax=unclassified Mesorhizobium TaxID=325217 RepID=UPI0018DCCC9B|nr:hypothetical protein [Mesorhizobium sp. LNHC252B00]
MSVTLWASMSASRYEARQGQLIVQMLVNVSTRRFQVPPSLPLFLRGDTSQALPGMALDRSCDLDGSTCAASNGLKAKRSTVERSPASSNRKGRASASGLEQFIISVKR